MYRILWYFFIYAFLGWCTEVSYAALKTGRFVNRGFLNGPVCPIYGLGILIVLLILEPLKGNLIFLFLGSTILTSLLELAVGFVLEKIFHQQWWNYSDEPFNLNGYICLRFSVIWGLACVFVLKPIHPTVTRLVELIPYHLGSAFHTIMIISMIIDVMASVYSMIKISHRLKQIDVLAERIKEVSDGLGENLADKVLDIAEHHESIKEDLAERRRRLHELLDTESFGQRRLLTAFPKMKFLNHRRSFEQLRTHIKEKHKDRTIFSARKRRGANEH